MKNSQMLAAKYIQSMFGKALSMEYIAWHK